MSTKYEVSLCLNFQLHVTFSRLGDNILTSALGYVLALI
jgi:hypothetical protein